MTVVDEAEVQRIWSGYLDRLRGLEGAEYDRAEQDAWRELQAALAVARGEPVPVDDPVG